MNARLEKGHALRAQIAQLVDEYASNAFQTGNFVPGDTPIPPSGKLIGREELKLMVEAALDGWLTTGRFNAEFQSDLAEFLGIKQAITVNSGSSANLVAFSTLTSPKLGDRAIQKGDEVITVAAGFPTTVNPILQFGAVPVFLDIELGTYNIKAHEVEKAISGKTKAVFLAHTLGNPFDLNVITGLCKKYGLWLIEDCCDALGATYDGRKVGTFGDLGTLSFYPAHHITMGEGGAVFTNQIRLKRIAESIRDWGRDCYCEPGHDNTCNKRFSWKYGELPEGYDHKYTFSHLGYNLKITDMQAACGVAQLKKAASFINQRRANFDYMYERLRLHHSVFILPEATRNSNPSWFGFPMTIRKEAKFSRQAIISYLDREKIGTRLLFGGNLTKQPYMRGQNFRVHGSLTNTDIVMDRTFWIGIQPALTADMLEFTLKTIDEFVHNNK